MQSIQYECNDLTRSSQPLHCATPLTTPTGAHMTTAGTSGVIGHGIKSHGAAIPMNGMLIIDAHGGSLRTGGTKFSPACWPIRLPRWKIGLTCMQRMIHAMHLAR